MFSRRLRPLWTLIFATATMSSLAHADIWTATRVWTEQDELRYSAWIESSFDESFFLRGDWAGIKTDCADAVYGSRIIFSYLEGLPFDLRLTDTKFSNRSTMFDRIEDPVVRVRAFIEFVNDKTWTGSLARHTYPVAIDRAAIVPGVIWLKPGHVETVRAVRDTGIIELRGSWLPAAIRKMMTITTLGFVPMKVSQGFRRWIWPQNLALPLPSQPGYSETQIAGNDQTPKGQLNGSDVSALERHLEISRFELRVQGDLSRRLETETSAIHRLAQDFCAMAGARSEIVQTGFNYSQKAQRCLTETEYHAYSTPSRDSNLRRIVIALGLRLDNDLGKIGIALKNCAPLQVTDTESVSAFDFYRKLLTLRFSSNPHEKPEARFGLAEAEKICVSNTSDDSSSTSND